MKYILVFERAGYPEEGGGTYCEIFDTIEELDKRAGEVMIEGDEIVIAGWIQKEYKYKAIETVIKVVRVN